MRKRRTLGRPTMAVILAACLGAALFGQARPSSGPQSTARVPALGGNTRPAAQVDQGVLDALKRTGVTAAAVAVVHHSGVVYNRAVGQQVGARPAPADGRTVFRAASLGKAVFAYLVFTLVLDLRLDLDKPLHGYLARPLPDYPEYADLAGDTLHRAITARLALSHRAGFPNWRWQMKDRKLRVLFNPGEKFLYSGEGYRYLQFVVEQVTGRSLETLAQERVFRPLGMNDTSFEWRDEYAQNCAIDREPIEKMFGAGFLKQANAAGSLLTTAADYGRFLAAVLADRGVAGPLRDEMLRPLVSLAGSPRLFGPAVAAAPAGGPESSPFWCLGWGGFRSSAGAVRFHVGYDSPEFEDYAVVYLDKDLGLVVLTAGGQGPASAAPVFVEAVLGPNDTPFGWAGYQ